MKNFIFGAIVTALLGSPQAFTVVQTEQEQLAAVLGGM